MKKNQKGFALIEALLILIILLLIAFAGWWVWQSKAKISKTQEDTANSQSEPAKSDKKAAQKPAVDPTADWKAYSNADGQYSLKHPTSWVRASSPELCTPTLFLVAGNAASVGKCASEGFGQMSVDSSAGNILSEAEFTATNYTDLQTEAVTVAGVAGKKQTGTYKQTGEDIGPGPQTGDKFVKYTFYTNGRTYSAVYAIKAAYPDVLSDFNTMVTKTLQFKS